MIEEKVQQVRAALKNLHIYRAQLHEQQRRDDLRETRTASVVETLTKIQAKLDDGLDWETKREIVKLLVRKIIVKTEKKQRQKIPVEMSPLFNGVVLHSLTNRADQYYVIFQISRVLAL
ncbi:MAG: hypothetical protein GY832_26675 [Chloroflexi bacterium]|nr:hypothetical protein [Chloroflexota bacterium]